MQSEVVIDSPYPREVVLPPLFAPWPQRAGVDLVALALGWSIGGVSPEHPHAMELNLGSAILGLLWANWVQRRGLGFAWRIVGFGIAGIIIGRSLLPPKAVDPAGNYAELVFLTGLIDVVVATGAGAGFWNAAAKTRALTTGWLDGYEAFRSQIWHSAVYIWPTLVALMIGLDRTSSIPLVVLTGLVVCFEIFIVRKHAVTRAALWVTCWTPVILGFIAYWNLPKRTPIAFSEWWVPGVVVALALAGSILLPVVARTDPDNG